MLLMCEHPADNSFIKPLRYSPLRFQPAWAKPIFWRLKPSIGFKIISMLCWLIGLDRLAAGRWQAWLCFTEDDCGAGFPCLVPVCQSSGPGSPGIAPPSDGIRDIPGTRIYSPAAEARRSRFRLLFFLVFYFLLSISELCLVFRLMVLISSVHLFI